MALVNFLTVNGRKHNLSEQYVGVLSVHSGHQTIGAIAIFASSEGLRGRIVCRLQACLVFIGLARRADLAIWQARRYCQEFRKGLRRSTAANVKQFTAPMGGLR